MAASRWTSFVGSLLVIITSFIITTASTSHWHVMAASRWTTFIRSLLVIITRWSCAVTSTAHWGSIVVSVIILRRMLLLAVIVIIVPALGWASVHRSSTEVASRRVRSRVLISATHRRSTMIGALTFIMII